MGKVVPSMSEGSNLDGVLEVAPWPTFEREDIEAANRVIESGKVNYWTGGETKAFEREFAEFVGSRHGIALANGTLSLELALQALGIGPGDEVIVSPRSFIASVSCVVRCGATPVFTDIDRQSGNIEAHTIEPHITSKTKAVIPVHLAGWPCDMPAMLDLCDSRNIRVIEDCAQAHGATIDGRQVGTFGIANSFSFCQDKILTTAGEGGFITTDDDNLFKSIWSLKDHGKGYDVTLNQDHPPGFRWLHESLGTNARMTEVQAAVGRTCLRRLPGWLEQRRRNAEAIQSAVESNPVLRVELPPANIQHAYYKLYVYVVREAMKTDWSRERIMSEVCERGVQCFSGSCSEIYKEKAFDGTNFRPDEPLPVAYELGRTSLMLLVHPGLSESYIEASASILDKVCREAAA